MSNSDLAVLLKAIEIISDLAESKEDVKKYIIELEEVQTKKPAEPPKAPAD